MANIERLNKFTEFLEMLGNYSLENMIDYSTLYEKVENIKLPVTIVYQIWMVDQLAHCFDWDFDDNGNPTFRKLKPGEKTIHAAQEWFELTAVEMHYLFDSSADLIEKKFGRKKIDYESRAKDYAEHLRGFLKYIRTQ